MDSTQMSQVVELRASYRYVKEHPWVVQAMTGFLSAYFMKKPGISRATAFCRIRIRHARLGVRDSPQHEGPRSLEATASGYSTLSLHTNRNESAGATALCHRLPRDRAPCLINCSGTDIPGTDTFIFLRATHPLAPEPSEN